MNEWKWERYDWNIGVIKYIILRIHVWKFKIVYQEYEGLIEVVESFIENNYFFI